MSRFLERLRGLFYKRRQKLISELQRSLSLSLSYQTRTGDVERYSSHHYSLIRDRPYRREVASPFLSLSLSLSTRFRRFRFGVVVINFADAKI